jgi:hypothetical protein
LVALLRNSDVSLPPESHKALISRGRLDKTIKLVHLKPGIIQRLVGGWDCVELSRNEGEFVEIRFLVFFAWSAGRILVACSWGRDGPCGEEDEGEEDGSHAGCEKLEIEVRWRED